MDSSDTEDKYDTDINDEYSNLYMKLTVKANKDVIKSLSIKGLSYMKFMRALGVLSSTLSGECILLINIYPDSHFGLRALPNAYTEGQAWPSCIL